MRQKLQTTLLDNADYIIYNPFSINWNTYQWSSGYFKHFVTKDEIYKFYLVSYQYYGIVDYEDIILLLNNIEDVFDLYPGAEIWIPKQSELEEFILNNSKGE